MANAQTGTAPAAAPEAPAPPLPVIGPDGPTGSVLYAWDPIARKERWRAPGGGAGPFAGGSLSTAGNLVFSSVNNRLWPSVPTPARRFSIWISAHRRWDPRFHSLWMENSTSPLRAGPQVVAVAEQDPLPALLPQDPQICSCWRSTERRHYRGPQLARSSKQERWREQP